MTNPQKTSANSEYVASDIYLAAVLLSKGMKVARIEHLAPRFDQRAQRCAIVFQDRAGCEALIISYLKKELSGDLLSFVESYCTVKAMVFR